MMLPDSKGHGANMEPTWGRQDPGWPHVGPMNFPIWDHVIHTLMNEIFKWRLFASRQSWHIFVVNILVQEIMQ